MNAPGWPGITPTWARSSKDTVGTALGTSRIWFTIGRGILNEVYWPSCSMPQIRDQGFIVAGDDFWVEVKRGNDYQLTTPAPAVPLPQVTHRDPRFQLQLEVLADPKRDVVLIRYRLTGENLRLYALVAPHLEGSGHGNTALVMPQGLAAIKNETALMLVADHGFTRGSAGFVGSSDGWQDFHQHDAMTWTHERATNGNVALMGELAANAGMLALGFGNTVEGARTLALSSLACGFDEAREAYVAGWERWAKPLNCPGADDTIVQAVRRAAAVLKTHDDNTFPGAIVASMSVPWGYSRDDPGGYHLVWPRDAVEAGFAMLACGHFREARAMLAYLIATQQDDGHWLQNFFADGRPYWHGIQLDEAALPVLLAAKLDHMNELGDLRKEATEMVERALRYVAASGPSSQQDRWEENAGINPFTIAAAIAALVAGAACGFITGKEADYALSLADNWNARIESWLYAHDTDLDRKHGTHGHYVRLAPPGQNAQRGEVALKNRGDFTLPARDLLGMEYLYLVRLGLRAANDPRIVETTKLVDAVLRVDTPTGPFYHRYNEDGYGEHADGSAFDGTGTGRAWPLLTGERGHYAFLAGEDAMPYVKAMLASASRGGMIPEQVWDTDPIPEHYLEPGRPSGSAMPLVWAHGELIKLAATMQCGVPAEQLPAVATRYAKPRTPRTAHWRETTPCRAVPRQGELLVEADAPFTLHYGIDNWKQVAERDSEPLGLGRHGVRIDMAASGARASFEFTRHFADARGWEGHDWRLLLLPLGGGQHADAAGSPTGA
ncbi:MAG TPA: glycoside hydrolase family 15 protein [Rhodanobacteraceae bacterium]